MNVNTEADSTDADADTDDVDADADIETKTDANANDNGYNMVEGNNVCCHFGFFYSFIHYYGSHYWWLLAYRAPLRLNNTRIILPNKNLFIMKENNKNTVYL